MAVNIHLSQKSLEDFIGSGTFDTLSGLKQSSIKNVLQQVQYREDEFLSKYFGCTREKFKNNIKDANTTYMQLSQLSGESVRKIISQYHIESSDILTQQYQAFQKVYNAAVDEIKKDLPKDAPDPSLEKTILYIANHVLEKERESMASSKTAVNSQQTIHRKINKLVSLQNKTINDDLLSLLPKETQRRVMVAVNQEIKNQNLKIPTNAIKGNIDNNAVNIQINFADISWFKISEGKKSATASELGPTFLRRANKQMRIEMTKLIKKYTGDSKIPHLNRILAYVFSGNSTALFIGGNENAITGILGEIKALCYLSILLGDKFQLGTNVLWAAQNIDLGMGQQPHADIIIRDYIGEKEFGYGIQVKNSVKDSMKEVPINFVDSTLGHFLERLKTKNVSGDISTFLTLDRILETYVAYYFNPEYQHITTKRGKKKFHKFIAGPNANFNSTRIKIENLKATADEILNNFAAALMYIGAGNALTNDGDNILFFIKDEAYFASEILKQIIDKKSSQFQKSIEIPESGTSKSNSAYTIINYLNEYGVQILNTRNPPPEKLETKILNQVKIKSSYTFQI